MIPSLTRRLLLLVLALALAGCGDVTQVREGDLVAGVGVRTEPEQRRPPRAADDEVRIAMITHGAPSSAFWNIVRNGAEAAARQADVVLLYRSPDTFTVNRMRAMIDDAVESQPDGIVVSIPSPLVADAIRHASAAGIPVVSVNSGSNVFRRLGALAHVGQAEERAGFEAGKRLTDAGARRGVCIKHEVDNIGLDQRCAGFRRALRTAGGRASIVGVKTDDRPTTRAALQRAVQEDAKVDAMLALSTSSAQAAMGALKDLGLQRRVSLATFDLSPESLAAVERGRLAFIVDQQPYLQGYLPIIMLANNARYGIFPAQGRLVPTGPHFVTKETAAEAIRLNEQGIR